MVVGCFSSWFFMLPVPSPPNTGHSFHPQLNALQRVLFTFITQHSLCSGNICWVSEWMNECGYLTLFHGGLYCHCFLSTQHSTWHSRCSVNMGGVWAFILPAFLLCFLRPWVKLEKGIGEARTDASFPYLLLQRECVWVFLSHSLPHTSLCCQSRLR